MPRYIDAEKIEYVDDGVIVSAYKDQIDDIPTADVAPVIHAHWIHTGEYLTNSDGKRLKKLSDLYVCHRCHRVKEIPEPYCNCGAKMDEEMEEDV